MAKRNKVLVQMEQARMVKAVQDDERSSERARRKVTMTRKVDVDLAALGVKRVVEAQLPQQGEAQAYPRRTEEEDRFVIPSWELGDEPVPSGMEDSGFGVLGDSGSRGPARKGRNLTGRQ